MEKWPIRIKSFTCNEEWVNYLGRWNVPGHEKFMRQIRGRYYNQRSFWLSYFLCYCVRAFQRNSVYTHAVMKAGKWQCLCGMPVNCRLGELIVYIPVWVWRSENQDSQWRCYCPRPAYLRPRRSWCSNWITFRQKESLTWVEGQLFYSIHAFNWLSKAHQLRESNLLC